MSLRAFQIYHLISVTFRIRSTHNAVQLFRVSWKSTQGGSTFYMGVTKIEFARVPSNRMTF